VLASDLLERFTYLGRVGVEELSTKVDLVDSLLAKGIVEPSFQSSRAPR
jgi:hypothetical protein